MVFFIRFTGVMCIIGMTLGLRLTTKIKILIVVLAVAALSTVAVYGYIVSDPRANTTCQACHSMTPFVQEISATEHGEYNCHVCHELTPGVVNEFIVYLTHNPNSTEIREKFSGKIAKYDDCLKCHPYDEMLKENQYHQIHYTEEEFGTQPCTVCHNPHQPKTTPQKCKTCHKESEHID